MMKKLTAWILSLALVLGMFGAFAEGDAPTFAQLAALEWSFSSGAGGWATELHINEDGSFSGSFHDSEMGELADEYPNGTVYFSAFSGQMTLLEPIDEHTWTVRVDSLSLEDAPGEESIDDDIRFVAATPYGISEGDEMRLFLPGTPIDALTEDMRMWAHLFGQEDAPAALESWLLYSDANESGFVGYAVDGEAQADASQTALTADELVQLSGLSFNVPDGAENVVYCWFEDTGMAEMMFTMDGDEYDARIQPAALQAGELMNISDMYLDWDTEEDVAVGHCEGKLALSQTGSEDWVELCQWYDAAPGLMYALSVYTTDPDGLDLVAVAQMLYAPVQGDA